MGRASTIIQTTVSSPSRAPATHRATSAGLRGPTWKPRQPPRFPADMLWVLAPGKDLTVIRATDG